jgi:hypothetical protein
MNTTKNGVANPALLNARNTPYFSIAPRTPGSNEARDPFVIVALRSAARPRSDRVDRYDARTADMPD